VRCDKIAYRTHTCATRFGSTAGIPEPVLNANEKRWLDTEGSQTGGNRFWGPPIEGGDDVLEPGLQIWYKCKAHQDWLPIPQGYVAVAEGDDDDFFSSSN
jgi:hypothetical protein